MHIGKKILLAALLIASLCTAGWVMADFFGDPYGLNSVNRFVCVATGEVFELSYDQAGMIPARNPKTHQRSLLPCSMDDDGKLHVGERYRSALGRLESVNRFVDPETLTVGPQVTN